MSMREKFTIYTITLLTVLNDINVRSVALRYNRRETLSAIDRMELVTDSHRYGHENVSLIKHLFRWIP